MSKRLLITVFYTVFLCVTSLASVQEKARPQQIIFEEQASGTNKSLPLDLPDKANNSIKLYGLHVNTFEGTLFDWSGPAEISAQGAHKKLTEKGFSQRAFSGCYFDGTYFAVLHNPTVTNAYVTYEFYNTETWTCESTFNYTNNSPQRLIYDPTFDPTTKTIYGCVFESTPSYMATSDAQLCYINLKDAFNPVNIIGDMGVRMRAMAATAEGILYGIAFDGTIYEINKHTAAISQVSKIKFPQLGDGDPTAPFDYYGNESAVIDYETGIMYLSYSDTNADTFILKVNPKTGDSELIANYGYFSNGSGSCDFFTGLFLKQTATGTESTPSIVTDLTVTPIGTELKATVDFVMPATDTSNQPLSNKLDYQILIDDTNIANGTASPSEKVSIEVPVSNKGLKSFIVYCVNGSQKGASTSVQKYIGPDTPFITSAPLVLVNGQTATIVWAKPIGLNGGNLAEPVTCNITRMPDNIVVGNSISGKSFSDTISNEYKQLYSYKVTPYAGGIQGQEIESRSAYVGTFFNLPYNDSFEDAALFNEYPIINANNDENTWWIDKNRGAAVYSSGNLTADDYLLIGPFNMKKGELYNFSMLAGGHSVLEQVAVFVGNNANDASAFEKNIIPVTTIDPYKGDSQLGGSFSPEADGVYYFAIKACSRNNMQNLYIYDVKVSTISGNAPAAPVINKVTPLANKASIEFTLPTTTINKQNKAAVKSVRIYRDNVLLEEITNNVYDGNNIVYEDNTNNVSDGMHIYSISALNESGEGAASSVSVFRGLDKPGSPTNLRVYEDIDKTGLIHVSWDAPHSGSNGGFINPEDLLYTITYSVTLGDEKVISNIKETSCDLEIENITNQNVIAVSVIASNSAGFDFQTNKTSVGYYGPDINMPMYESWNNMEQKSGIWAGDRITEDHKAFESYWDICTGESTSKEPQDNDGGMMACSTTKDNGGYRVRVPRVNIKNAENPTLVFYYYYTQNTKDFNVEVITDNNPISTLQQLNLSADNANKWIRQEISLKDLQKYKKVQIAFCATTNNAEMEFACIDNVSILDFVSDDLAAFDFTTPIKGLINEKISLNFKIRNNGSSDLKSNDYQIKLYKNDNFVSEIQGKDISADSFASFELTDIPSVVDPVSTSYHAEIVYSKDKNLENNVSEKKSVHIITPIYPKVNDLKGNNCDKGIKLSWSAPNASDTPNSSKTESFETYQAFTTTDMGDWKLHDGDNAPTVILQMPGIGVLEYPHIGERMAWQVFDPEAANLFADAWYPRSGKNMLVSFQACKDGKRNVQSDDWLISPKLFGKAQTISFYARAGMKAYSPEIIDIMYSTTGNNISDFKKLATDVKVTYSNDWKEYIYELPEGTCYFAIVHKSYNCIAVLVDDITFIPAESVPEEINLQGYNIYRNGIKINEELVQNNEYTDENVTNGQNYVYQITAVWDKGESGLSNAVNITATTSIDESLEDTIKIYAANKSIIIETASYCNALIYNDKGICIENKSIEGFTEIPVSASGMYIVKIKNVTKKVLVL